MKTRTEFDSIGSLEIPVDAYYGVQSLRAKTTSILQRNLCTMNS